ncbi:hypothetical protein, partial [Prevotella sp. S7 MS 2]|uniref:hypothetical protein n=1 Tax=Prevotella sp. S7 MS 2 TaxID=1287488 RepID=UPI001E55FEEE
SLCKCMKSIWDKLHLCYHCLMRIPRTRGFGVQSPFAYRFLRRVVAPKSNGTWPVLWLCSNRSLRKEKLLSRLNEYCCEKNLTYVGLLGEEIPTYEELLEHLDISTVLFIDGIQKKSEMKYLWLKLLEGTHRGGAFDLYDCGILFFNQTYYKRVYKVNY